MRWLIDMPRTAVAVLTAACLAGGAAGFALPPGRTGGAPAPLRGALSSGAWRGRFAARALSKISKQPSREEPPDCCGKDAARSLRLPAQGIDLPDWVDRVLAALFAVGGLLPASIKLDEALQNGRARIEGLTNAETSDGVRMFVARPEVVTQSTAVMVVIHQVHLRTSTPHGRASLQKMSSTLTRR